MGGAKCITLVAVVATLNEGRGDNAWLSEIAEDCILWSVGEVRTEELRLNFPKCGLKERRLEK